MLGSSAPLAISSSESFGGGAIDVYLQNAPQGWRPLDYPLLPQIGIAHRRFLDLFGGEADLDLHLGHVFDERGRLFNDHVTFMSEKPILVRGGRNSRHYQCPRCSSFCYARQLPMYVLRSDLTDQRLYESYAGALLIDEDLASRIDRHQWRGLYFNRITVRDTPLDGLDALPDNYYYMGPPVQDP